MAHLRIASVSDKKHEHRMVDSVQLGEYRSLSDFQATPARSIKLVLGKEIVACCLTLAKNLERWHEQVVDDRQWSTDLASSQPCL